MSETIDDVQLDVNQYIDVMDVAFPGIKPTDVLIQNKSGYPVTVIFSAAQPQTTAQKGRVLTPLEKLDVSGESQIWAWSSLGGSMHIGPSV